MLKKLWILQNRKKNNKVGVLLLLSGVGGELTYQRTDRSICLSEEDLLAADVQKNVEFFGFTVSLVQS